MDGINNTALKNLRAVLLCRGWTTRILLSKPGCTDPENVWLAEQCDFDVVSVTGVGVYRPPFGGLRVPNLNGCGPDHTRAVSHPSRKAADDAKPRNVHSISRGDGKRPYSWFTTLYFLQTQTTVPL